jgi:hypothetical protein
MFSGFIPRQIGIGFIKIISDEALLDSADAQSQLDLAAINSKDLKSRFCVFYWSQANSIKP